MRQSTPVQLLLEQLGLVGDEAVIYLNLTGGPKNHLDISRATGIARSSVYRIVDELASKGLVHYATINESKVIEASEPAALEQLVVQQELQAEQSRNNFTEVTKLLKGFAGHEDKFAASTYTGEAGFRQMLWNELRANQELYIFSCGTLDAAVGRRFAEKYRAAVIERGIKQRAIENIETKHGRVYSSHQTYDEHLEMRFLPPEVLDIQLEISIYGDTIAVYNTFGHDVQLGTEIKNPFLASLLKQMFEHYWQIAEASPGYTPVKTDK